MVSDVGGIGIASGLDGDSSIRIEADGGVNETIVVHSNHGTGVNAKGDSTNASISLLSDAGGIGLYSAFNNDNAITLEANGGANETIQIRSNQGTGVATAEIANTVNASIALVSDVGGIGIASGLDGDNSIRIEADGGVDETIVVHANQGTGEGNGNASIELVSDVGGICLTATGLVGVMTDTNSDAALQLHAAAGGIGLRSTANLEGCIQIEADGGADETIVIHSDQGTGADAISLTADVGGVSIDSADNSNLTLTANAGADKTLNIKASNGGLGEGVINIHADKLGFFAKAAVNRPAHIVDATDANDVITQLNLVIAALENLGLIASS